MPKYTFEDTTITSTYEWKDSALQSNNNDNRLRFRNHQRQGSSQSDHSLSYSAGGSSIASSTDSSFAGIRRAMGGNSNANSDSRDIAEYLKRHGVHDEKSVGSLAYSFRSGAGDSLAYSTDAESLIRSVGYHSETGSQLQGTALVSAGYVPIICWFVGACIEFLSFQS
jgi:hypothetical protein